MSIDLDFMKISKLSQSHSFHPRSLKFGIMNPNDDNNRCTKGKKHDLKIMTFIQKSIFSKVEGNIGSKFL
jgi:hypothetical protein